MRYTNEKEECRYPDFIKEAQTAYNASPSLALRSLLMKKQGGYTIEDYYALPEQCRVELIDGVIYNMAAPDCIHQTIVFQLAVQLDAWIKKKKGSCMVFIAPADVQLDKDNKTMVQPDLFVACRREKLRTQALYGEPDLVVEVLSPSNTRKEQELKYRKYKNAGVREYWAVDPQKERVTVYSFEKGRQDVWTFEDRIPVGIFDGEVEIDFAEISQALRIFDTEGEE